MGRLASFVLTCFVVVGLGRGQDSTLNVPRPEAVIGFAPGTDRRLADPSQIEAYFSTLAQASPRLKFETFGASTEGRPMKMAIITSPRNHARLEEIRKLHLSLVDPRNQRDDEKAKALTEGRAIISMHSSIHSVEVGPAQSAMEVAWQLCRGEDPETQLILDEAVVLLNPIHNPDGYEKVVDWYRRWVGTPHEGAPMVELYHRYVGHDNNRDWFMATQAETTSTVRGIHRRWRPLVTLDQHQMGPNGARMFVPPYQAPWDPAIPPGVVSRTRELGAAVMKSLVDKGHQDIVTDKLFDAWSPSRSTLPYHGGVRFLTEIASAQMASPLDVKPSAARAEFKFRGPWALRDIVRLNTDAALAAMAHIARHRHDWLTRFRAGFEAEVRRGSESTCFVIRHDPKREYAHHELLRVLAEADVEVGAVTREGVSTSGTPVAPGDWVVRSGQPFFPFAESILRKLSYPVIRNADGKVRPPYDVTVNHLPTLLGLHVEEVEGLSEKLTSAQVMWTPKDRPSKDTSSVDLVHQELQRIASLQPGSQAKFGILHNNDPLMAEGWMRWWFKTMGLNAISVADTEIQTTLLGAKREGDSAFDTLILPGHSDASLRQGPTASLLPTEYRVGLGAGEGSGAAAIKAWVQRGGHLVAIGPSTSWAIREFGLPLGNVLNRTDKAINLPGTAVALSLETQQPFLAGLPRQCVVMADRPHGFEFRAWIDPKEFLVLARFAPLVRQHPVGTDTRPLEVPDLVRAGYAEGAEFVADIFAVVRARVGSGTITLIGFDPVFRGWTIDAWPLFLRVITPGIPR